MYLGETRELVINITSNNGETFVIEKANVEMFRLENNILVFEQEVVSELSGTQIKVTICPQNQGLYVVKVIMDIANEKVIKKFRISVGK
jgi:hypothetical protein